MKSTTVDDRRRIVMPPECPPHSAVTIEQLDAISWLVKKQEPDQKFKVVLIPTVEKLPDDVEWEKKEAELARYAASKLPPLDE